MSQLVVQTNQTSESKPSLSSIASEPNSLCREASPEHASLDRAQSKDSVLDEDIGLSDDAVVDHVDDGPCIEINQDGRLIQSSIVRTEYKTTSYNLTTLAGTDSTFITNNNTSNSSKLDLISGSVTPPAQTQLFQPKSADTPREPEPVCTEQQLIKQETKSTVETRTETCFERSVSTESTGSVVSSTLAETSESSLLLSESTESSVETSYITSTTWNPKKPESTPPSSPPTRKPSLPLRKPSNFTSEQPRKFSLNVSSPVDGRTRVFISPDKEKDSAKAFNVNTNSSVNKKINDDIVRVVPATNKNIRALINRINRRSFVESEIGGNKEERSVSPGEDLGLGEARHYRVGGGVQQEGVEVEQGGGARTSTIMKTEFKEKIDSSWEELFPGEKSLPISDLKSMLDQIGLRIPNWKVRSILEELNKSGMTEGTRISRENFEKLCEELDADNVTKTFKVSKQTDVDSTKFQGHMGAHHFVRHEEEEAFADWINKGLAKDKDTAHFLPLSKDGSDMYSKMDDGVILCKIINLAAPDTIDERVLNKGKNISIFKRHENLTLAIKSAQAIGCTVIGMDSHNLQSTEGKKWMVMGLVWQLIKMYLFSKITVSRVPGLVSMLRDGEDISDIMKLSPEQLLLRWVNYQLEKAGSERHITNFGSDIKDSEIYTELISQIAPKNVGVNKTALQYEDLLQRAETMLEQADKIDCRQFVTAKDVVQGQEKLNMAFVANLFNNYPGLEAPEENVDAFIETREEKMYRNWMNSLGINPRVNYLYSDLYDGIIIFKIYDVIKEGTVNWDKVNTKFAAMVAKKIQQILENCNYAVTLGRKLNFVLVGIAGSDIMEGNKNLTLALVWQMMRAYTLSLLSQLNPDGTPIVESEIIHWANTKLAEANKNISIKHFQDKVNRTALPILHLIDVIKPDTVDFSLVKQGANLTDEECLSNAKYAVNVARMINAPVYALPEDICEVKHKMVMTVYASLMLADNN